jgi:hypothetical protein
MTDPNDTRSFDDVRDEVTGDRSEKTIPECELRRLKEQWQKGTNCEEVTYWDDEIRGLARASRELEEKLSYYPEFNAPKFATGTIAGHSFSLRMDASAPDELVADIEAALASVKADYDDTQAGDGE